METKTDEKVETSTSRALKQLDAMEATLSDIRRFVTEGVFDELAEVQARASILGDRVYVYVNDKARLDIAQKLLREHGARGKQLRSVTSCYGGGVYPTWTYSTLPWLEIHWQHMDIEEAKAMGILKATCRLETVGETRNTLVCDI